MPTIESSARATVHIVVPLDVPIILSSDVLGRSMPIDADGYQGTLHWPIWDASDAGQRDAQAPKGFERAPGPWGAMTSSNSELTQVAVERIAFTFNVNPAGVQISVEDLPKGYAKGVGPLRDAVQAWVTRFCVLGPIIVRQPLDPAEPSPLTISRPSDQPLTWLSISDAHSWIDTEPPIMEITTLGESAWSERVADRNAADRMVDLASSAAAIPSPVTLLSTARVAAHRARLRLALMEMGTCLEAVLTMRLGLPLAHKETLGPLTKSALRAGIPLPENIQSVFVGPRNAAVHQGVDPSASTVEAAFGILDVLVNAAFPAFAPSPGAPVAHRPQRFDLHIIRSSIGHD